eukprot:1244989-Pyramimonas_sp.AAC.2
MADWAVEMTDWAIQQWAALGVMHVLQHKDGLDDEYEVELVRTIEGEKLFLDFERTGSEE